jgi:hypothetical protein
VKRLHAAVAAATAGALIMAGCSGHPTDTRVVTGKLVRVGGPAPGSPVPLPGSIKAVDAAGHAYAAKADRSGRFRLTLPPGVYTVTGHSPLISSGQQLCAADGRLRVSGNLRSRRIQVICSIR